MVEVLGQVVVIYDLPEKETPWEAVVDTAAGVEVAVQEPLEALDVTSAMVSRRTSQMYCYLHYLEDSSQCHFVD